MKNSGRVNSYYHASKHSTNANLRTKDERSKGDCAYGDAHNKENNFYSSNKYKSSTAEFISNTRDENSSFNHDASKKQSFNKYKGNKKYNRKAPRVRNLVETEQENSNQRKRSTKREEKEEEEIQMAKDSSSSQLKNKQLNQRKSHVTFKNSNIQENRTSTRSQADAKVKKDHEILSKSKTADDVPPKIKRKRQHEDCEENLENKKTNNKSRKLKVMKECKSQMTQEFSMLREGNSKYSTLTESYAAGSHLRKSFMNIKPILKRANRISKNRETFDEKHFQNFKKNVDTNDLIVEDTSVNESRSGRNKISDENIK